MAPSRITEPLTAGGTAPVVDQIAPPPAGTTDNALTRLLAATAPPTDRAHNPTLDDEQRGQLWELARLKREKSNLEKRVQGVRARIGELEPALLELREDPDLELDWDRPFEAMPDGDTGFEFRPFLYRRTWPKYREHPDTDEQYTSADVAAALDDLDLDRFITVSLSTEYTSWVGERVKRWRQTLGSAEGIHDADGRPVDLDGEPIGPHETDDPRSDALALPAKLRSLVTVVEAVEIRFTRPESAASKAVRKARAEQDTAAVAMPTDADPGPTGTG